LAETALIVQEENYFVEIVSDVVDVVDVPDVVDEAVGIFGAVVARRA
jgi:hypothetical protein